ncbi:hypothetical protein EVAR_61280_1 [Eumeta japonica]|uniref:Uncharacterized protein n=1 Tax=Eumeta variegata TaxID=151549 RepID=A0A4C1XKA2_EUMVA|nr:hypothetical protein EVAR_61280_1 [Eumeta japonica]
MVVVALVRIAGRTSAQRRRCECKATNYPNITKPRMDPGEGRGSHDLLSAGSLFHYCTQIRADLNLTSMQTSVELCKCDALRPIIHAQALCFETSCTNEQRRRDLRGGAPTTRPTG